jgi:hypothetical protein
MIEAWSTGSWSRGPVEWTEGDTAFLSVVFSWDVSAAYSRACWYRQQGYKVRVGGPGVFTAKRAAEFRGIAEVGGRIPGTQGRHNPMATKASEGCDVGCAHCIVWAMEGKEYTLLPEFEPRPVLTDNNLSGLPGDYQQYIVDRYRAFGVPLLDANSGFEPKTFDDDTFERWKPINRGPWRFGLDETFETTDAKRCIDMLRRHGVSSRKIRVYVMIGREPFAECMERIRTVIGMGAEPYVQPFIKLNAPEKKPWIGHDWSPYQLKRVQRWANSPMIWRKIPFEEYRPSIKTVNGPDARQRDLLFADAPPNEHTKGDH